MTHETRNPTPNSPAPARRRAGGRGALLRATRDPELAYTAALEMAEMAGANVLTRVQAELLALAGKVESLTNVVRGLAERLTALEISDGGALRPAGSQHRVAPPDAGRRVDHPAGGDPGGVSGRDARTLIPPEAADRPGGRVRS